MRAPRACAGTDAVILVANVAAGDPFGLTCKAWPANPDLLLVAVPLMRDQSEAEAADGHEGDLDVLVLERATLKPLRQRRLKGLMMDDAVALTSLTFDTARYDLMPDRRAFGIRISRAAGSRVSLYGESSLRLFVMGERELEMVLDGMVVSGTRGDWDTRCAGDVEERKVTVGLGSGSSQGYRDLSLTEARERRLFETQGDDCGERTVGKDKIRHARVRGQGLCDTRGAVVHGPRLRRGAGSPRAGCGWRALVPRGVADPLLQPGQRGVAGRAPAACRWRRDRGPPRPAAAA